MNISDIEENNSSKNEVLTVNNSPETIMPTENNSEIVDSKQNESETAEQSTNIGVVEQPVIEPVTDENNDKLTTLIANFTTQLKETNRLSQERELVIDRLHEENQRLKHGEIQQALLPVFRDLIRLYDDLSATASKYVASPDSDEKIGRDLSCYKETIADILYRYGVEPVEVEGGKDFNPKEHKAVGVAPTKIVEEDRKISKIIRDGFRTETRIIRNAEVEVYRYSAPAVDTAEPQTVEALESKATETVESQNKPEIIETPSEAK